ncbi:hypothetical protein FQN53_007059 [Emmonsiellopsis sp. PD_33]|nr:hypothetical protein FQN53_007059 [Emmonsiellopsis sp. PD_33]KAK2798273.1 hypothetical protein FQN51_007839 [Onygenales sp. PD_10]
MCKYIKIYCPRDHKIRRIEHPQNDCDKSPPHLMIEDKIVSEEYCDTCKKEDEIEELVFKVGEGEGEGGDKWKEWIKWDSEEEGEGEGGSDRKEEGEGEGGDEDEDEDEDKGAENKWMDGLVDWSPSNEVEEEEEEGGW